MGHERTVLVFGGTGSFGSRLVEGILATSDLRVVVAGRSHRRGRRFAKACNARHPGGRVAAVSIDAARCRPGDLQATGAFLIVDAAGPYQTARHVLAEVAIAARLHYVDLADSRGFVAGFSQALDARARQAGVVALAGASSTPALSNAALDEITRGWRRVDEATIAISPGNRAPRGLSVIRAILSYAGQPVRVFKDGEWVVRSGWGMARRAWMPGLGRRWLSLCETPDLDIVPARHNVRRSAVFLAGLELPVLHLGLLAVSLLVRLRLVRSLVPVARVAKATTSLLHPFGTDRGGMTVLAVGLDGEGRAVEAQWSLVAESGDGPTIPTLPALAAVRAIAEGRISTPGARPCVGQVPLADIELEMRRYRISTWRTLGYRGLPLLQRALGASYAGLPEVVREVHDPGAWMEFTGAARVEGADTMLARLAAALFRLPKASAAVPVRVTIDASGPGEVWTRDFGGRRFKSHLTFAGQPGHIFEQFGPFRFDLALQASKAGVRMEVTGWRLGPIHLPRFLAAASVATETVDEEGNFRFDVPIELPFGLGRIVRYTGILRRHVQAVPAARRTHEDMAAAL